LKQLVNFVVVNFRAANFEVSMISRILKLRTAKHNIPWGRCLALIALAVSGAFFTPGLLGQATAAPLARPSAQSAGKSPARPKLVVLLVVDQMRADYVDKFLPQWTGGLRRLVEQGAWFRNAAYPYATTETCVGHATISTGALPASHAMVANAWWDRETQKMVTCTADPNTKNSGYAGVSATGGDSAWRMEAPSFAEELKFQTNGPTRIVTFSLKARAAITMAGHKANAVTWAEGSGWVTSSVYGTVPFVEQYAKTHPIKQDYGKTWTRSLPDSSYWYEEKTEGAVAPEGWNLTFPHPLRGKAGADEPDAAFYQQWAASPFADAYLTRFAETAVDALRLGKGVGTDFLGVSYSSLDYVGHHFGPRSWEVQDVLIRLDKDLADLFAHLDKTVGAGNYVVAFSADHGVAPVPEDLRRMGVDAGVLHIPDLQSKMESVLEPFHLSKPAIARIQGNEVYFAPDVYEKLRHDDRAMRALIDAARAQPGVAEVFRADQLQDRPATQSPTRTALADSYFAGRSGDLFVVNKPYWLMDATPAGKARSYGASHGTLYNYDQAVPILFMGFGIQHGTYFDAASPADIAPTLASLCGITLARRDGHILAQALAK
jgi:predicted AlkP superfamily pyrophosphatase or phosphodiesterase